MAFLFAEICAVAWLLKRTGGYLRLLIEVLQCIKTSPIWTADVRAGKLFLYYTPQ